MAVPGLNISRLQAEASLDQNAEYEINMDCRIKEQNYSHLVSGDPLLVSTALSYFSNTVQNVDLPIYESILQLVNHPDEDLSLLALEALSRLPQNKLLMSNASVMSNLCDAFLTFYVQSQSFEKSKICLSFFCRIPETLANSESLSDHLFSEILRVSKSGQLREEIEYVSSILSLFKSIPNGANPAFLANWLKSIQTLLEDDTLPVLQIAFDSARYLAEKAPESILENLCTERFLSVFHTLVNKNKHSTKVALLPICSLTGSGDHFSLFFLDSVVQYMGLFQTYPFLFCRIIRNFSSCSDQRVLSAVTDPYVTQCLLSALEDTTFLIRKEALITLVYICNILGNTFLLPLLEAQPELPTHILELGMSDDEDTLACSLDFVRALLNSNNAFLIEGISTNPLLSDILSKASSSSNQVLSDLSLSIIDLI